MTTLKSKKDTVHALAATVAEFVNIDTPAPQIVAACRRIFNLTPLEGLDLDQQISACRLLKQIGGPR